MMKRVLTAVVFWFGFGVAAAHAQPHPRLFLDDAVRKTWAAQAKQKGSAIARSVDACKTIAGDPARHVRDLYMGLDWARHLQHCLVAWAATGDDRAAKTALRYFTALIDDLENVGDGKGGDKAATRDSGFAIRALGPYTALAYDWLHDHPDLTPTLKARARSRWAAWTTWYLANGYRARSPSTNYHAGYLAAVTFIAIAQRGEAGPDGDALWRLVADELWGKDMTKAMAPGGVLDGGGWGEGWQYGPLSVAEYAASARAMAGQGVVVPGVRTWLDGLLLHTIHARAPGGGTWAGGDTQWEEPNLPVNPNTLFAVMLGDASPTSQAWAAGELATLPGQYEFPLYAALAWSRGVKPVPPPRASWPTAYRVAGTGTFFARTGWDQAATWVVSQCSKTLDVDHAHNNAGNFALSRGADDLIIDPTPYGSLSTLTGNAPTIESDHLPLDYKPSQAWWSERTGFTWATQTASGVIATRCDYADQYKFQHRPSDVPAAVRDLVVVPWGDGNASAIVVDRAASGAAARGLHLRFRTTGKLESKGVQAIAGIGNSKLRITTLATSGGTPAHEREPAGSCFTDKWTRGNCAAARFAIEQWRLTVPGPTMTAMHAFDAVDKGGGVPAYVTTKAGTATVVSAPAAGFAVVVGGGDDLAYPGPRGARHVVLDGPTGDTVLVSASPAADGCQVTLRTSGGGTPIAGRPRVFTVGADCAVAADAARVASAPLPPDGGVEVAPPTVDALPPVGEVTPPLDGPAGPPSTNPRTARSGCCGAEASPGSSLAMAGLVGVALVLRRRRRGR